MNIKRITHSTEDAETIAQQLHDAYNDGDINALDQLVTPTCIDHSAESGLPSGIEALKLAWAQLRYEFPDRTLTVRDFTVDRDHIQVQAAFQDMTAKGLYREAMLLEDFRVDDGKIVEMWNMVRWN